jgi:hypothetical protein
VFTDGQSPLVRFIYFFYCRSLHVLDVVLRPKIKRKNYELRFRKIKNISLGVHFSAGLYVVTCTVIGMILCLLLSVSMYI